MLKKILHLIFVNNMQWTFSLCISIATSLSLSTPLTIQQYFNSLQYKLSQYVGKILSESIKQNDVNEQDPVSQYQSENDFDDSTFDGSDLDEEYSDDTVTSGDNVTGSSFSEPLSFGEEEEKSEVEEV